jgi:hypothetical protein
MAQYIVIVAYMMARINRIVSHHKDVGKGYREDHMYYSTRAES